MEKLTVLLLEDNQLDAELALETLHEGGFDCQAERVETRDQYLAAIGHECFDLILADYSLPSYDGISALEIAQEKCPDIPFIFVSGAIGEELAIETLKSGATDYVLKQRLARLAPSVRRALREAEERRARRRAEQELADLLEREKAARHEAEVANRIKDQFLATVSHELRTPLNAILGWISLLRGGKLDDADVARAMETIERSARAQNQLIEDLLDVSRIITGKLHLQVAPVDPALVTEAAVEALRPTAEAKKIKLTLSVDPSRCLIAGDQFRLQQVVWNLVSNALKFTPEGGVVAVRLQRVNSHLEIQVADNGKGIGPEFLPYVFDPFRQEDGSSARKFGGLGLGMAIVRHLVKMHGGEIKAESQGYGHGATFTVTLPALSAHLAEERAPGGRDKPEDDASILAGVRILVAEDAPDTRQLLKIALAQYGAEVRVVSTAAEAYAIMQEWRPDILVSDIGMPEEDGYSLIRRVRMLGPEKGGNVPAIALTAFAQAKDRAQALNAGFQLHVPKPVDAAELAAAVTNLLARAALGTPA